MWALVLELTHSPIHIPIPQNTPLLPSLPPSYLEEADEDEHGEEDVERKDGGEGVGVEGGGGGEVEPERHGLEDGEEEADLVAEGVVDQAFCLGVGGGGWRGEVRGCDKKHENDICCLFGCGGRGEMLWRVLVLGGVGVLFVRVWGEGWGVVASVGLMMPSTHAHTLHQ